MRAVREDRVLTLKQEPTGTRKDFGVVGYLREPHVSYLIFPKPLKEVKGKRVIGIKYDALRNTSLATPKPGTVARGRSTGPAAPPKKPKPRPKRFAAIVRLTATNDAQITVEAMNEKEARAKAVNAAREGADLSNADWDAKLLRLQSEPAN